MGVGKWRGILHTEEESTPQLYLIASTQKKEPKVAGSSNYTRDTKHQGFYKNIEVRNHFKANKKKILGTKQNLSSGLE